MRSIQGIDVNKKHPVRWCTRTYRVCITNDTPAQDIPFNQFPERWQHRHARLQLPIRPIPSSNITKFRRTPPPKPLIHQVLTLFDIFKGVIWCRGRQHSIGRHHRNARASFFFWWNPRKQRWQYIFRYDEGLDISELLLTNQYKFVGA